MEARFNVRKEARKALVTAVSEIIDIKAEYQFAPSCAYAVGGSFIDRNGTITFDEKMSAEEVRTLLAALAERDFVPDGSIDEIAPAAPAPEVTPDFSVSGEESTAGGSFTHETTAVEESPGAVSAIETPDTLVIEVPLMGFTHTAHENLEKMVTSKAALILKAIGVPESDAGDDLPIERTETTLRFPWFPLSASKDAIDAYASFVLALCELAKKQKRVTMKDVDIDSGSSEKFAFRCFLLRLGFKGDEYKSARRVLLSKLSGNGSFKSGNHKKTVAPTAATVADSGAVNESGGNAGADDSGANSAVTGDAEAAPQRCGECGHHCYYTDGLLRTNTGDIVDTSKRTPEKYTHYCLNAPSGFRKIKHASEWSGFENAPSWCQLNNDNEDTGANTNGHRNCLACTNSLSEAAENDNGPDRLFCVERQVYVEENGCCEVYVGKERAE